MFHEPYPQGHDAVRFRVPPASGPRRETLAFYFPLVDADSALLVLHWGETVVPIQCELAEGPVGALDRRAAMRLRRQRLDSFGQGMKNPSECSQSPFTRSLEYWERGAPTDALAARRWNFQPSMRIHG